MNIPNFEDVKVIDKDGFFTDEWRTIMEQLFQALQQNVGDEGFNVPPQSTTNITSIVAANPPPPNGRIFYDSTANQFQGMKAGVLRTFTLT